MNPQTALYHGRCCGVVTGTANTRRLLGTGHGELFFKSLDRQGLLFSGSVDEQCDILLRESYVLWFSGCVETVLLECASVVVLTIDALVKRERIVPCFRGRGASASMSGFMDTMLFVRTHSYLEGMGNVIEGT